MEGFSFLLENGLEKRVFSIEGVPGYWVAMDAGYSWNGWAVPLLTWSQSKEVSIAVGDEPPEPYEGVRPVDGLCWKGTRILRAGDVARFRDPADDTEAMERFILLEDPQGGRVLVECICSLPIRPSRVLLEADLAPVED
jgi:hypothetical protein